MQYSCRLYGGFGIIADAMTAAACGHAEVLGQSFRSRAISEVLGRCFSDDVLGSRTTSLILGQYL